MNRRVYIPLIGILFALIAMLSLAGCGEQQAASTQQQLKCEPNAPSIIPATQGRPMLVYFFKDT